MSTQNDYWKECISIAADECDLTLTPEQLAYLADAVEGGHEHYEQAFYSPPANDRLNDIEREIKRLRTAMQKAADQIRRCDYTPARSTLLVALDFGHSA